MTRTAIFAPLAALSLVAAGASPAFAKSQNEGAATSAGAKAERKICKTIDATGARTRSEKVCLTKAQWKKLDAQ